MSAVVSRTPILRLIVAVLVLGFGTLSLWGEALATPSAEPTVQAFLLHWQEQRYQLAAGLTTGRQAEVTSALRNAYRSLDAPAFYLNMGPTAQTGHTAQARFGVSVDLGQDGAPWSYVGVMRLRWTAGTGWRIVWSPSVINPYLKPGEHLAVVSSTPPRGLVLASDGAPLQTPSDAWVVGVMPGRLAHPEVTARGLADVTGLDTTQVLGWIRAAPARKFLELVTLRPSQYAKWGKALRRVPGLGFHLKQEKLFDSVAPDVVGSVGTEVSSVLRDQGIAYRPGATVGKSGLQRARQQQLAGTPTTRVVTQTQSGRVVHVLKSWPGQPSDPVHTTIDLQTQRAANSAVKSVAGSTAIVAVDAATGHVQAVAENTAPGMPTIYPLSGHYPPGGAFTIVSTDGVLISGLNVNASIECPGSSSNGGRKFTNPAPQPQLGLHPRFSQDFAASCLTAFTHLSQRTNAKGDLIAAARQFGLGAHWSLALPSFSGSLHEAGGLAGLTATLMGESGVQVSPLSMAMVAAEVDTGIRQAPSLLAGAPVPAASRPLSAANLTTLQQLTHDVVASGAARRAGLRAPGGHVGGQVGTVRLPQANGVWAHWFVGYRGDMAFAVLRFTNTETSSAVQVGAAFLASAPAG